MDFDEIFIRINLQNRAFFLIIIVVAHDALLVGLDPDLGTATFGEKERTFVGAVLSLFLLLRNKYTKNDKNGQYQQRKKRAVIHGTLW